MKTMDFQTKTTERILSIFADENRQGQKRVLLSDEVGLGKTIMARAVIDGVRRLRFNSGDDYYRIVYVCSNQNIIHQNIYKLVDDPDDVLRISDSRLSMQHLVLQERMAKVKAEGKYGEGQMPTLLVPLTPGTSFTIQGGGGSKYERALMYAHLRRLEPIQSHARALYNRMKLTFVSDKSWANDVRNYEERVCNCGEEYINHMHQELLSHVDDALMNSIIELCNKSDWSNSDVIEIINEIRQVFSDISLNELQPDLVVMDEFQRFSDLIDTNIQTEEATIAHRFFADKNISYVLLLSATPYKPFTTLEELNENNCDEQYEDFLKLMRFLNNGQTTFNTIWEDYSNQLTELDTQELNVLFAKKKNAEDAMYQVMCRTERLNEGLIRLNKDMIDLTISEGDVLSYCQMQHILDEASEYEQQPALHLPMDYVKSSPYLLSFMQHYKEKVLLEDVFAPQKHRPLPLNGNSQLLLIKRNSIVSYKKIASNNAKLDNLRHMLFDKSSQMLLWIPASHPYYQVTSEHPFALNADFSKVLVFSSWEMVPRMLAIMLSYDSERLTISKAFPNTSYDAKKGANRLVDIENKRDKHQLDKSLLTYASPFLASLYNPQTYYEQGIRNLAQIQQDIEKKIRNKAMCLEQDTSLTIGSEGVLHIAQAMDGRYNQILPPVTDRVIRTLAQMAIAAPAICMLRIVADETLASQVAVEFVSLFNRRESAAIVDDCSKLGDVNYFERVLEYCAMGNLQSVLDEFAHMIEADKSKKGYSQIITKRVIDAFIGTSSLDIDTTDSFCKSKSLPNSEKLAMRRSYAYDYGNGKVITDKTMQHNGNLQQAFNSPFRPFVLTTTSVGQEGLDFHYYSRKIVHWNMPSNPVDLEQREGRINRYKCLAVRRNIAHLFSEHFDWNEMFKNAEKTWKEQFAECQYSQMVPYWCLPREVIQEHYEDNVLEWIERIVPMYPLSSDQQRYQHLIDVLSLYRLTMGQPRQEELLEMLDDNLDKEDIRQLIFNLSPYDKAKQI